MKTARATVLLVIAEGVFTLSGYIVSAALGRILGVADYGRYALVISLTTLVTVLAGRAIPTAMARYLGRSVAARRSIVRMAAILQGGFILFLTTAFYFSAPLIARGLGDDSLRPLLHTSALIIPAFALSSFHVSYFNGLKHFGAQAILKISRGIFRGIWIITLGALFGVVGAISGAIIAPLSVAVIAQIIDRVTTPLANSGTESFPARTLLRYAASFAVFTAVYELYLRTDIYLIKAMIGQDSAVGLYSAAMTVAMIPYYLSTAVALMLFPTIATADAKRRGNVLTHVLQLLAVILPGSALLMALYATPLLTLLFGSSFSDGAPLLVALLPGMIFGTLFYVLSAALNAADAMRVTSTLTLLGIAIIVTANSLFLKDGGTIVAAIAFSGSGIFLGVCALLAVRVLFSAQLPYSTLVRCIPAALATVATSHALDTMGVPPLVALIIATAVYGLGCMITRAVPLSLLRLRHSS